MESTSIGNIGSGTGSGSVCVAFERPWNYLVAIILVLLSSIYVWNRMKISKKVEKTEPEKILEEITPQEEKIPTDRLKWELERNALELGG